MTPKEVGEQLRPSEARIIEMSIDRVDKAFDNWHSARKAMIAAEEELAAASGYHNKVVYNIFHVGRGLQWDGKEWF